MENTKIEWATHTFNPWIGCTQVSPGCLHCYAETRDKRHLIEKVDHWGKGALRLRTSPANWKKPVQWNRAAELKQADLDKRARAIGAKGPEWKATRPRVFCASLADWLDDEVPIEWLADLLKLIHATPNLDWLLLTKRPKNWRMRVEAAMTFNSERSGGICTKEKAPFSNAYSTDWKWLHQGDVPTNIWIGTTVEDQTRADERIPELLKIPAKVRFLSCEPLLGPVLLDNGQSSYLTCNQNLEDCCVTHTNHFEMMSETPRHFHGIDWVICGGESGPGARPMQPDWARALRDQCVSAGVAFHFKQWGEFVDNDNMPPETECPEDAGFRAFPNGATVWCVGKRWAGRLLNGREWNEVPT